MKQLYQPAALALGLTAAPALALAQDLTNAGAILTVAPGTTVYVGTGGLSNQSGILTNAGALRVDGSLTNAGTLDLSSGTLEVRGDLTNAGTVVPGTSITTFSGATDQVLMPGGASLYQVVVNKPTAGANTLRLAGDLTVANALNLSSGLVNTKAASGPLYTLRLPNGASLSGEASGRYVLGSLAITRNGVSGAPVDFGHGAVLDPTSNNLGTVTITRTAGLQTADVSYGQNVGGTTKGIDRIYTVSAATPPSAAVQLTLSWLPDNDNGLTDFSQMRGWQQRCQDCGKTGPLEAHHCYYLNMRDGYEPWEYPLSAFRALCPPCHKSRDKAEIRMRAFMAGITQSEMDTLRAGLTDNFYWFKREAVINFITKVRHGNEQLMEAVLALLAERKDTEY